MIYKSKVRITTQVVEQSSSLQGDGSGMSYAEISVFESLLIEKDIENLTSTATIRVPFQYIFKDGVKVPAFKRHFMEGPSVLNLTYTPPVMSSSEPVTIGVNKPIYISMFYYKDKQDEYDISLNPMTWEPNIQPFRFIGYITDIDLSEDGFFTIKCQDEMYRLKEKFTRFSVKDAVLNNILDTYIIPKNNVGQSLMGNNKLFYTSQPDVKLGNFRTEDINRVTDIFTALKTQYKLYTYFKLHHRKSGSLPTDPSRGGIITDQYFYCGLKYPVNNELPVSGSVYKFNNNLKFKYPYSSGDMIANYKERYFPITQNNLTYNSFNKATELIVVAALPDFKNNIVVKSATIDGINIITDPVTIEDETKKRSSRVSINIQELNNSSIDSINETVLSTWNNHPGGGLTGSFTTFAEPPVEIADIVTIWMDDIEKYLATNIAYAAGSNKKLVESYYVDGVTISINAQTGLTQTIRIGSKVNLQ